MSKYSYKCIGYMTWQSEITHKFLYHCTELALWENRTYTSNCIKKAEQMATPNESKKIGF